MKSIKLLLLSTLMFVVPAVAIDLQQSRKEAIQKADSAISSAINYCSVTDGHELRMEEIRNNTYKLSALEINYILKKHDRSSFDNAYLYRCGNCDDIRSFVRDGIYASSDAIEQGRGHMSAMDLRNEYQKRTENK
jgi:hypothetical protein